jgi:hypothetical protein
MSITVDEPAATGASAAAPGGAVLGDGELNGAATTVVTRRPFALPWRDALARVQLGRGSAMAIVMAGLVAGLAVGWLARSQDLLSERVDTAPSSTASLPALWMAPHWDTIARQASADDQYHFAQLCASSADQEAAWIAVPGYFPTARAWVSQAYIQLARVLLHRHDASRLKILATEIEAWNAVQGHEHERELVTIIQAGTSALDGDQEGTIVELEKLHLSSTIDPALLELALEVTVQATHSASRTGNLQGIPPGLKSIQARLLSQLSTVETSEQQRRRQSG